MTRPEIPVDDYSLRPEDLQVRMVVFGGLEDIQLRKRGLKPGVVDSWTQALLGGKIPEGFSSLQEFEEHVLTIIKKSKKR